MSSYNAPMVSGDKLTAEDREHVLAAFVHRFTGEHRPQWANGKLPNGKPYSVQFKDDAEWLANTLFYVRRNGQLDRRFNECRSTPTWPFNPEHRKGGAR